MPRGLCVVITGPTACGKTTAVKSLLRLIPGSARLVTTTSRKPRPNEVNGVDYHFLAREDFEARAGRGEFLEYEENYGNYYGSSRIVLDEMRAMHSAVFAVLDPRGGRTYKAVMPDTIVVFLRSPIEQVRGRLERRKGARPEDIERRLEEIRRENEMAGFFDHVVESLDGRMESVVAPAVRDILLPRLPKGLMT